MKQTLKRVYKWLYRSIFTNIRKRVLVAQLRKNKQYALALYTVYNNTQIFYLYADKLLTQDERLINRFLRKYSANKL